MRNKLFLVLAVFVLGMCDAAVAQTGLASLFDSGASDSDVPKKPTIIDSDTMDMDITNNISIFIGNVVVDSTKIHITCERMEMYMEEVKVNGKVQKQLKEIHCFKNREGKLDANDPTDKRVVIVRNIAKEEEEAKGKQRSFSGKAVYNVKTGEIVLTDEPILVQGINEIHGTQITIWRDSEVMNVKDGHIRYIDPEEQ